MSRRRGRAAAGEPRNLLQAVLARPGRLPELLAGFALRHNGPRAARTVARLRAEMPDADASALGAAVIARGTRATVAEGAFVGGPFLVFIPVAFCAALLRQARTVMELAAVTGLDPTAPERAAELLVLQGVYPDTESAARALTADPGGAGTQSAGPVPRSRWAVLVGVTLRMARLLGLLTTAEESRGSRLRAWLVRIGQWALLVAVLAVGMVVPLVWMPYMAVSYRKATRRLLARAADSYLLHVPPPERRRTASRLDPGALAGVVRVLSSVLVPVGVVLLVVFADVRTAGGRWPALLVGLAAASAAVGAWWHLRRRRGAGRDGTAAAGR
ncbi:MULTISPECIES: hypothetical protein [Streptomyces]|uniref:hypothetical protein n=1 Tax=Streptomyces TaxID=1883 RepID=UPI001675A11C|nr:MULTISPECIES: hypothetical protein [Streptomyces]MBD3580732.1 hypothetical protein [Streptomyces sp. KD18]GGT29997.1 hypothetical protein GCM10010286_64020 [Streptomyces toxytricini]